MWGTLPLKMHFIHAQKAPLYAWMPFGALKLDAWGQGKTQVCGMPRHSAIIQSHILRFAMALPFLPCVYAGIDYRRNTA
jgi:hypothetical protein